MTNPADTQPEQGTGDAAGPARELAIPKHRFDEVLAQVRQLKEENQIFREQIQNVTRPAQPAPSELKAEDFGMDPDTFKAVARLAEHIAENKVRAEGKKIGGYLGQVANRVEKAEFLVKNGKEQEKYLERARAKQLEHHRATGGYMDLDTAYKLAKYDEFMERQTRPERQAAAPPARVESDDSEFPNAEHTRASATSSSPGNKSFGEMTDEEMEAQLDERIRRGNSI